MKIKARKRVLYEFNDGTRRTTVEFVRAESMVERFHRVVIDGVAKDWLRPECPPTLKNARFFYDKHAAPAEVKP